VFFGTARRAYASTLAFYKGRTMNNASYLQRLTTRLAEGLARLPAETRQRHAAFLRAAQLPDGSFPDREGGSDLYYTGFALRGLAALDALDAEIASRAADYLRASLTRQASVVDFYSLLYSCLLLQASTGIDVLAGSSPDWPERVAATLETFRTSDGGYAKQAGHPGGGSTYHTFLVGLCYELLGRTLPQPEIVLQFAMSRRREDGGFVEVAPMRRGGTNPTAAAIGLLELIGRGSTEEVRSGVIDFLAEMPSEEGGMRANARAPLADLLSTFTALWTLEQLGGLDSIDRDSALAYVHSLERESGGFHGGRWDTGTDVEYTFYGLGTLALLS
jgi:geranylgeranyl transferase type-2 subunit beta